MLFICILLFSVINSDAQNTHRESAVLWQAEPFGVRSQQKEIQAKRDAFSKHFQNENGTITAHISSGPIHYMEEGAWKTIFHSIVPTGNGFQNTTNTHKTYYPATSAGAIKTVLGNGAVLKDMMGMRAYYADSHNQVIISLNVQNKPGNAKFNELTYPGVYGNGIDLRLTQNTTQRKMDYIIHSKSGLGQIPANAKYLVFEEKVDLPNGWTADMKENVIYLKDAFGTTQAQYEKPVFNDTPKPHDHGQHTEAHKHTDNQIIGNYTISQNGDILLIKTEVPLSWLTATDRNFPVIIDPTLTILTDQTDWWTGIITTRNSSYSNPGIFSSTSNINRVGGQSDDIWLGSQDLGSGTSNRYMINHGWVKFSTASIPNASTVSSVEYRMTRHTSSLTAGTCLADFYVTPMVNDPSLTGTHTTATILGDIRDGAAYASHRYVTANTGLTSLLLGSGGVNDVQASLASDWFAVGLYNYNAGDANDYTRIYSHRDAANRPSLIVDYVELPCSGTPAPGNTLVSVNPACSGTNFTLSLQNTTIGSGVTYQWQSASNSAFTTGVTNLGTAATQVTNQTATRWYRCLVTCTNSGQSAYSSVLQVNTPAPETYGNNVWNSYAYNSSDLTNYLGSIQNGITSTVWSQLTANWGTGAAVGECASTGGDYFTTSHRMNRNFPAGVYVFSWSSDDGIRISTDGGTTWNIVTDFGTNTVTGSAIVYLNGSHNIRVDHRENTGGAAVSVSICQMADGGDPTLNAYGSGSWRFYQYQWTGTAYDFPTSTYTGTWTAGTATSTAASFNLPVTGGNYDGNRVGESCGRSAGNRPTIRARLANIFTKGIYQVQYGADDYARIRFNGGGWNSLTACCVEPVFETPFNGSNINIEYEAYDNSTSSNDAWFRTSITCQSALTGTLSTVATCSGAQTLTLTGARGYYTWQSSTDGVTFTDFGTESNTATSPTPTSSQNPSVTTWYRVKVESCNGTPVYSNAVSIIRSIAGGNATICAGSQVNLNMPDEWVAWPTGGNGGRIPVLGATNEYYHIYTTVGSSQSFTVPAGNTVSNARILVVGGGGGGGSNGGGGGGAGGFYHGTGLSVSGNVGVTVGGGGAVHANTATSPTTGQESSFGALIKCGGGGGGTSRDNGTAAAAGALPSGASIANVQGSGGGGAGCSGNPRCTAGGGTFSGGGGRNNGCSSAGGGGGGASSGGVSASDNNGGNGGAGIQNNITGSNSWYAGGGGGGTTNWWTSSSSNCNGINTWTNGTGGSGVGGTGESIVGMSGGVWGAAAPNPVVNTGSGGGADQQGATGVVIVRYRAPRYTSSNPAVASVNELTGVVTGNAPGTATITYTDLLGCTYTTSITVEGNPVDGSLTASTPTVICLGGAITAMPSGGTGTPQYWVESPAGSGTWNIAQQQAPNAIGNGYTYTPTAAGTYRIHARWRTACGFCWDNGGTCTTFPLADFTVVDPVAQPSAISGNATICTGTNQTYSVTNVSNVTYTWSYSGTGTLTGSDNARTLNATTGGTLTVTPSNACGAGTPRTLAISVDPSTVVGGVSSNQTICYGASAAPLTLSGNTGTVTKWQRNTGSWTDIASTAGLTSYNPGALTTTTQYRAVVQSGACPEGNSTAATVTVPAMPTAISTGSNAGTCGLASENGWVYFANNSNQLLAAIQDNTGGGNMGSTQVSVTEHGGVQTYNGEGYMQRVTAITPASNVSSMVRLYFTEAQYQALKASNSNYSAYGYSDLRITKFAGTLTAPSGSPTLIGSSNVVVNGFATDVHYIEFANTNYSTFFIHFGNDVSPLPISLSSFEASCENGFVKIDWVTESETNNELFTVSRSADLMNWEEILTRPGGHNSNQPLYYTGYDERPLEGISYYRLTQRDYDGTTETFAPVGVVCQNGGEGNSLAVYPNPINDVYTVRITAAKATKGARLNLSDMNGKTIQTAEVDLVEGVNEFSYDRMSLSSGTYILNLTAETFTVKPVKVVVK